MTDTTKKTEGGAVNSIVEHVFNIGHAQYERAIKGVAEYVIDVRPIAALVSRLSAMEAEALYNLLPMLAGAVVSTASVGKAKNPVRAQIFRETVQEFCKELANLIKERNASPEAYQERVNKRVQDLANKFFFLNADGHVHLATCVNALKVPEADRKKVSYKDALEQKRLMAACCIEGITAELSVATPTSSQRKSALEVLGSGSEDAKKLLAWIKTLPADQKRRVYAALEALDSENELRGLVAFIESDAKHLDEVLGLLEEQHTGFAAKKFLGRIGESLSRGMTEAAEIGIGALRGTLRIVSGLIAEAKEFDAGLATKAAEQCKRALTPITQPSWLATLKKLVTLDLF